MRTVSEPRCTDFMRRVARASGTYFTVGGSSATMTPEQEAQQKMMKVMMVVMFPVMMYNAPSGLAVYFITNSTLGILEGRYVRAHIDELDKNPPPEKSPGWGRKKVENQARSANPFARERETRRFKDR